MMKSLEAEFLASRDLISRGPVDESIRILSDLKKLSVFREADTVLLYCSMPGEVETFSLLRDCVNEGKRVVIPKVQDGELRLKLLEKGKLAPGFRGIPEPSDDAEDVAIEEVRLAVVPGVAFSLQAGPDGEKRYYRLGRGGGYYDRLIPLLSCPVVGVCYPFRFVDSLPLDEWDAPIDLVLH